MEIKIIGSGDAFGTGGKYNTCFLITLETHKVLVDCGASSLPALKRAGVLPNSISTIFITHFHGDHFGGLPFFLLDAHFVQQRKEPLTIVGPLGLEERVNQVREALFQGSSSINHQFELHFIEMMDHEASTISGIQTTYFPVIHAPESNPHGVRLSLHEKTFSYSGDSEWTENLIPLSSNADLFIVECFNYSGHAKFHMSYETLQGKLSLMSAKRVMLTHLGPEMIYRLDDLNIEVCQDGDTIEI